MSACISSLVRLGRILPALLLALGLAGCGLSLGGWSPSGGSPERASALPGTAVTHDDEVEEAILAFQGGRPALPPRLQLGESSARLPGAYLPGLGEVRPLVIPVAFGAQRATRTHADLTALFGGRADSRAHGAADVLYAASGGLFRMHPTVLPQLLNPDPAPWSAQPSPRQLRDVARTAIESWAARQDLSAFDSDGGDGLSASTDDDGVLDMVFVVVESTTPFAAATIPGDFTVRHPGRAAVRVGSIHVISLARGEAVSTARQAIIAETLGALGLSRTEMFFPADYPLPLSTLARLRLGWLPALWAGRSGDFAVREGEVLTVPVLDVADSRSFWLIERSGSHVFLSRLSRDSRGHFATVESRWTETGADDAVLPLTRRLGVRGPRIELGSQNDVVGITARVLLTPRAITEASGTHGSR